MKKRAQLIVTNNDIRKARDCYAALRDLVIQNSGGWDDADKRLGQWRNAFTGGRPAADHG